MKNKTPSAIDSLKSAASATHSSLNNIFDRLEVLEAQAGRDRETRRKNNVDVLAGIIEGLFRAGVARQDGNLLYIDAPRPVLDLESMAAALEQEGLL